MFSNTPARFISFKPWVLGAFAATLACAAPAWAALTLAPLILDFSSEQPARGDVELYNSGDERLFVAVEPFLVEDPGRPSENKRKVPDPEALGLLATPNRLVIEPGQRKFLRIAMLKPPGDLDRVYRVTVKPVVGDLAGTATGLKIIVGYEMLVLQRPLNARANLSSDRHGDVVTIRNTGNTNAELFQGKQCDAQIINCVDLPSHRIYAGAAVDVSLKPGFTARYTVKVQGRVSTSIFGN